MTATAAGGGERVGSAPGDRRRPPRPHALRRYGQNHLVDDNVLRAIVEQAAVRADEVVLEVGAADGQLTRPLLQRARLVHAFEIDRRFAGRLEELARGDDRLRLHFGDALKSDLRGLDPPPTALIANLAYNIAIPLIMTTVADLPGITRWAVMVQKELGDRLFAVPSTKAYAAVSVLVQLSCRRERVRAVPATAFRPRPRVESSFVTFTRRVAAGGEGAGDEARADETADARAGSGGHAGDDLPALTHVQYAAMDRLVRAAFAQRRKVLTNTLAGAARAGVALTRDQVRDALESLGLPAAARPEELTPAQWLALAGALDWLPDPADSMS
jgi:16S rRNA (adenine1518-N6/adenine1519-N6)-dimethyltransferase